MSCSMCETQTCDMISTVLSNQQQLVRLSSQTLLHSAQTDRSQGLLIVQASNHLRYGRDTWCGIPVHTESPKLYSHPIYCLARQNGLLPPT